MGTNILGGPETVFSRELIMKESEGEITEYMQEKDISKWVNIIEKFEDYEEVGKAFTELAERDESQAQVLGEKILIKGLGDQYLQGFIFHVMYGISPKVAIDIIEGRIDKLLPVVLRDVMDELATDCYQEIAQEFSNELLRKLKQRYMNLTENDRDYIQEEYERFEQAYKERL